MTEMTPEEYLEETEEEQSAKKPNRHRRLLIVALVQEFEFVCTEM